MMNRARVIKVMAGGLALLVVAGAVGAVVLTRRVDRDSGEVSTKAAAKAAGSGAAIVATFDASGREKIDSLIDADREFPESISVAESAGSGCQITHDLAVSTKHVERLRWCVEDGSWRLEELEREVDLSGRSITETYACDKSPDLRAQSLEPTTFTCVDGDAATAVVSVERDGADAPLIATVVYSGETRGTQRFEASIGANGVERLEVAARFELDLIADITASYDASVQLARVQSPAP